jgi:hypothetical protein
MRWKEAFEGKSPGSEAGARLGFACHGGHRDVIASATTGICARSIRRNAIADDANSAAPFAPDKGLPLGIGDKVGATTTNRARADSLLPSGAIHDARSGPQRLIAI